MPYIFRQGDLPKLDLQVDRGTDFMTWKLQWDSYLSLSGLAEENAQKQVQALTLCFSRDTLSIVQNLGLTKGENKSVESIIHVIKCYIDGQVNETVERRHFCKHIRWFSRVSTWASEDVQLLLRHLCKQEYSRSSNNRRHTGCRHNQRPLTAKAISKCQAQEAAKKQRAHLHNHGTKLMAALHNPQGRTRQPLTATSTCQGCGVPTHPGGRS